MNGTAGTWQGRRECGQIYENIDNTSLQLQKIVSLLRCGVKMDISMCKQVTTMAHTM